LRFLEGKAAAAAQMPLGESLPKMQTAELAALVGITRLHEIFMLEMSAQSALALALEAQAARHLFLTKRLEYQPQTTITQAQALAVATPHLVHTLLCLVRVQRLLVFLTQQAQQVRVMHPQQAQRAALVGLVVRTQSEQHFLVPPSYRFMLAALLEAQQQAAVELELTALEESQAPRWQSQVAAAVGAVARLTQQQAQWQQLVLVA